MKRDFLGDSYDAVKRLWQQVLVDWAPLFAEPQFLPEDLRDDFTRLTGIPLLTAQRPRNYSILNDPDTGMRLPREANQAEGRTHISFATVIKQLQEQGPRCVVTFDQSDYRHGKMKRKEQRRAKMAMLDESGFPTFYYVSHAPFLFAFPNIEALAELRNRLICAGIPEIRFEQGQV
jgi:hypothetical protein